jgi:uncharacterized coiled-coil protein SlyX
LRRARRLLSATIRQKGPLSAEEKCGDNYEQVNAMLLNEFLKEDHKVHNLEATVARQQKQMEALTSGLEKVSASRGDKTRLTTSPGSVTAFSH